MDTFAEIELKEALITGAKKMLDTIEEMVEIQLSLSGEADIKKILKLKRGDLNIALKMLNKE